jgi:hypothetical protein
LGNNLAGTEQDHRFPGFVIWVKMLAHVLAVLQSFWEVTRLRPKLMVF